MSNITDFIEKTEWTKYVKDYIAYQLSVIPTKADKLPALTTWKPYQTAIIKTNLILSVFTKPEVKGIAIVCGAVSGNLEVIDVDTKHDTTGSLWIDFKGLIEDNLPDVYNKLVIAQTRSGGYHIYYRCSVIEGNKKLAVKSNREVLLETRGEGGYIIAPPSPGYKYIQGDYSNIPTITPEEREILFNIAKSFNEIIEEIKPKIKTTSGNNYSNTGGSPFEAYNETGDVVELLQSKGWKVVTQRGERINLLRPGSTDSKSSGNYHTGLKVLRVFSSSTEFNPDKGYSPAQVFSLLECRGDDKLAYRKLLELGYGEPMRRDKTPPAVKTERIKVELINKVNRVSSVISNPGESLRIENIKTATGDEIVINSPGPEAQDEVLKAIELIEHTGKRIYIKEGDQPEVRSYQYKLQGIINKYLDLHDKSGDITLRDEDNFLDEVMIVASSLEPIDKDRYKKLFLSLEAVKELGISEESLSITVDRLTSTKDKEDQAKSLQELISKVKDYQDKGETTKALELLDKDLKNVRVKNIKGSVDKLKEIPTEEDIKLHFSQHSESLRSGYYINGNELLLPSGGLTGIAGATNHGKTDFLINLTLNAVKSYPDKEFYYFTYEMSQEAILVRFLNTFLDTDLEVSSNHRAIKTYFKTGSTQYIKAEEREYFTAKVKEFFERYINSGRLRVKGVDFYSPELNLALTELNKKDTVGGYFIDYFQLLRLPKEGYKNYSRQEELKVICQDLNDTAKRLQLPIILGAQFNREVTTPFRLHPTNIGEAGDIERILDTLIGIWNTSKTAVEKDMSKAETTKFKDLALDTPGLLYTYILKSRETATDVYELLNYNGKRGVISNQEGTKSNFK